MDAASIWLQRDAYLYTKAEVWRFKPLLRNGELVLSLRSTQFMGLPIGPIYDTHLPVNLGKMQVLAVSSILTEKPHVMRLNELTDLSLKSANGLQFAFVVKVEQL